MALKKQIQLAIALGILSLILGVAAHLALTDIYHAEGDLTLEWNVLRAFAAIFLFFIAYTLTTLRKILRVI
jgi:hypothetical protein